MSRPPAINVAYADGLIQISHSSLDKPKYEAYRKALDGAHWNNDSRRYEIAVDKVIAVLERLTQIRGVDLRVDRSVADRVQAFVETASAIRDEADARLVWFDEIASRRGLALYPFQREGARWLASRNSGLLADQMGLGKSCQALAALPYGSAVVVCPANVRGTWRAEISKWRPDLKAAIPTTFRWPGKSEVVILNYERLVDAEKLELYETIYPIPDCLTVIADEGHYVKSFQAKRTKRWRALANRVRARGGYAWTLTGTPLLNKPGELWTILENIGAADEAFGSYKNFLELHDGREQGANAAWGLAQPEVADRLRRVMLRRKKSDVLTDLPDKIYTDKYVDVDIEALNALDEVVAVLQERGIDLESFDGIMPDFHDMSRVRAQVAASKISALLTIVEEAEEEEEPLVVFSAHRAPVEVLKKRPGWGIVLGGGDYFVAGKRVKEAQAVAEAFQEGRLWGVALSIGAGSTGLTLTRSNQLVFVDQAWTPGENDQASDRVHRIGQTRACQITTLVADHPLERRIAEVLAQKRRHIEASVDSAVTAPDADLVTETVARQAIIGGMIREIADLNTPVTRPARSDKEREAASELPKLAESNEIAKALAENLETGLTDKEWKLAIKLVNRSKV